MWTTNEGNGADVRMRALLHQCALQQRSPNLRSGTAGTITGGMVRFTQRTIWSKQSIILSLTGTGPSHLSLASRHTRRTKNACTSRSAVDDSRLRAAQRVHRSGLDVGPETVIGVGVAVGGHLSILRVPLHALRHGHLADIAPATAETKSKGADQCTCGAREVHVRCTCGARAVHVRCTCGARAVHVRC